MGGQALGAVMWGAVADTLGLTAAFLLPAAGLVLAALLGLLLMPLESHHDVRHSELPVATAAGPGLGSGRRAGVGHSGVAGAGPATSPTSWT